MVVCDACVSNWEKIIPPFELLLFFFFWCGLTYITIQKLLWFLIYRKRTENDIN